MLPVGIISRVSKRILLYKICWTRWILLFLNPRRRVVSKGTGIMNVVSTSEAMYPRYEEKNIFNIVRYFYLKIDICPGWCKLI